MPAVTAVKAFTVPSTSVDVKVPVAVGVPEMALLTPPASITVPVLVPMITAASFTPVIVTTTFCVAVPSWLVTTNVSVTCWPKANACTVALVLSNV